MIAYHVEQGNMIAISTSPGTVGCDVAVESVMDVAPTSQSDLLRACDGALPLRGRAVRHSFLARALRLHAGSPGVELAHRLAVDLRDDRGDVVVRAST